MKQEIFDEVKRMFKYCDIQEEKVIFSNYSNNDQTLLPMYEVNNLGVFAFERGNKIKISDMGNLSLNMLGFYAIMNKTNKLDIVSLQEIIKSNSKEEIYNIFIRNFGLDFLNNNLYINSDETIDNAYQLILSENEYAINYVADNKYFVVVPRTKLNIIELSKDLFQALSLKKQFDEKIVSKVNLNSINSEELLKLFATFKNGVPTPIYETEKKNKSLL